eukprot:s1451_g3.t1
MAGGEKGCRLVQSERLRDRILEEVVAFCGGSEDVREVAEGQPFRLRAMRRLLEMAGDGDYEFLKEAEVGFPVGVKHPLPRTPSSYERQVEWSLNNDPTAECALARENYPSAKLHEQHLRAHLEAEVAEGLVDKMTVQAFEDGLGQTELLPPWQLCHYLLGPGIPIELLLYADDLESLGVGKEGRKGTVMAFIYMAAMGSPFKWGKQRGGLCTEWVGVTSDYGSYSFGLSRKRAEWLVGWMRGICKEKKVEPRIFAAGLGRLGFAATALQWEKPFLGPLYVWSAAIRDKRGKVLVPWAILTILDWISRKMEEGRRMEEVKLPPSIEGSPLVVFTDARASEHDACIGGYLALHEDLKLCPWFSVEVNEDLAPWVRSRGGNPKRTIAALELLATLVATKLWAKRSNGKLVTRMRAFTDNRGNSFALNKGMSTKYPLTLLLLELAEELRDKDIGMDLEWIRRDDNTVADDLSNGRCDAFDPQLREEVTAKTLRWLVLEDLQKRSEELYEELKSLKLQGKVNRPGGGRHQVGTRTGIIPPALLADEPGPDAKVEHAEQSCGYKAADCETTAESMPDTRGVDVSVGMPLRWDPFGRDGARRQEVKGDWTPDSLAKYLKGVAVQIDNNLNHGRLPTAERLDAFVSRLVLNSQRQLKHAPKKVRHRLQATFALRFQTFWNFSRNEKVRNISPEELKGILTALVENLSSHHDLTPAEPHTLAQFTMVNHGQNLCDTTPMASCDQLLMLLHSGALRSQQIASVQV